MWMVLPASGQHPLGVCLWIKLNISSSASGSETVDARHAAVRPVLRERADRLDKT